LFHFGLVLDLSLSEIIATPLAISMTTKVAIKTTFEAAKTIEPIYTGGDVSLDESGRLLATCVEEDVLVVDIETGVPVTRIEGDGEPVTSLCLSPSASHLVICSRSLSMRIYALSHPNGMSTIKSTLQRTLKPHQSPVVTSTIDDTGYLLATGGADGTVKVWDVRGGYVTHTFHGHGGIVSALCLFQMNSTASSHSDSRPKQRGKRKSTIEEDDEMTDDSGSPIFLASGAEDGKIRVWNLNKKKSIAVLQSHVSVVRSLDYSLTQNALLSAGRDRTVIVWDAESWKSRTMIPVLEVVESAGFVLEGHLCYSGGENGILRIWNTSTGREVTKAQNPGLGTDAIVAIEHPLKQGVLLSVHQDQTLRVHSLKTLNDILPDVLVEPLKIVRRISGNLDEIIDLALVGPDRSLLALAANTESVRIVSGISSPAKFGPAPQPFGSDIAILEGHEDIIICLDVDWSGHWLATGAKDNSARLWRLDPANSSYTCVGALVGHAESIGAVALPRTPPAINSPALKDPLNYAPVFLLTGSQDRTIKRWDISKLVASSSPGKAQTRSKAIYTRVAHEKDINALDVSPTSPIFASASQDRTIKIWSLDDGSVVGILRGHKRGVWSIRFAPANTPFLHLSDGGTSSSRGLLASGSGDRTIKIWSLSTYTCLLTFEGHSNSVLKVVWLSLPKASPNNEDEYSSSPQNQAQQAPLAQPIIASASSDTLIKLWSPYASTSQPSSSLAADERDSDNLLTTLSHHSSRIWSLASHPSAPYPLLSGDASGTLTAWLDTTASTHTDALQTAAARIAQDQELQNHIRAKNYREGITLALQLNHPGRLLKLFEDVIVNLPESEREEGSITGSCAVDQVLRELSHGQLWLLLQRIRDWNSNARTAPVAQRILNCLLRSYPTSTWTQMARERRIGGSGMKDMLRALEVYTERHFRRIDELVDESFLVEYTLLEMDEIGGGGMAGITNGHAKGDGQEDMTMV
jgi:U3 small nucleolar RNA-associated protein 13